MLNNSDYKAGYKLQIGIGRLTLLVFGSLLAVTIFCAYQILPFYYYYYELVNQMDSLARVADLENDKSIRTKLAYHMKKMQIPADIENVKIIREGNKIRLSLKYEEVFYITYRGKTYDLHVFPFHAQAEARY
jgi:hypothetical protein